MVGASSGWCSGDPGLGGAARSRSELAEAYSVSADTAALAYVQQQADIRVPQSLQEGLAVEAVDADGRHLEYWRLVAPVGA